jgi:SRSO17 transposase
MVGPLSPLERQSLEPRALAVDGGNVRGMPRFMREDLWDEAQRRHISHQRVYDEMGDPDGVVMVDERGCAKQGQDSVGVARPYGGTLGTVEPGQVGVLAAYASRHGSALLDTRRLLPEPWLSDAYAPRRATCQVPPALVLQTTPPWAGAMGRALAQERLLPFTYLVADGLDGHSPALLDAVEACRGLTSLVAMPSDTRGWLQGPVMHAKHDRDTGAARTARTVAPNDGAPPTVKALANPLPDTCWYRRVVAEGTTGPLVSTCTTRQVTRCRDGLPDRAVWRIIKRACGAPPSYGYSISNAPLRARVPLLVWFSGGRWAIEPCFAAANTALGMEHDEVRTYPGWQPHRRVCL